MVQLQFTTLIAILLVAILISVVVYFIGRLQGQKKDLGTENFSDLPPNLLALYQEIQNLPSRVLSTIQGSINPQKGKVAELLTYAELRYDYDVIIPLGKPVDFIGIKNGQKIDFIEVKSSFGNTSSNFSLTAEEKEVQKLIKDRAVNFRLVVVKDNLFTEESK